MWGAEWPGFPLKLPGPKELSLEQKSSPPLPTPTPADPAASCSWLHLLGNKYQRHQVFPGQPQLILVTWSELGRDDYRYLKLKLWGANKRKAERL